MVVPPNTIDFSTVFSAEKFLESMPVFCTVIIVMLIYVGGLVWARHMDKKDLLKVSPKHWHGSQPSILLTGGGTPVVSLGKQGSIMAKAVGIYPAPSGPLT